MKKTKGMDYSKIKEMSKCAPANQTVGAILVIMGLLFLIPQVFFFAATYFTQIMFVVIGLYLLLKR